MAHEQDPPVRIVDRRWWARAEEGSDAERTSTKPTYVEELERRVTELTTELQEYAADHRQAVEEFEQARLRLRRDVTREVERGKRAVLVELLEVLDNLDRAIAAAQPRDASAAGDTADTLVRGVQLVRDQFLATLEGFGVTRIGALGQPFDAARHEAVTTAPVETPARDGVVVAVVKEGYAIGDELLRPAAVVVGRFSDS